MKKRSKLFRNKRKTISFVQVLWKITAKELNVNKKSTQNVECGGNAQNTDLGKS